MELAKLKAEKNYVKKATSDGVMSNRKFWNTVKSFLRSKGFSHNDNISININGNVVKNEQKLTKEFNSYYINIKTTSGSPPIKLENNLDYISDSLIAKRIIEKYKNHLSIKAIQDTVPVKKEFKIEEAKFDQVNKVLRNINSRKATGLDKIPPKIVRMSANIIDSRLTNILNSDLKRNAFSDSAKVPFRPIFKEKGERTEIKNYRLVSIQNCFSKGYERFIHKNLTSSVTNFQSNFISAYRKGYSANHVLLRLTEIWTAALDSNLLTGAALMDSSKAFNCIPHDLLIAKLHAYGFSFKR